LIYCIFDYRILIVFHKCLAISPIDTIIFSQKNFPKNSGQTNRKWFTYRPITAKKLITATKKRKYQNKEGLNEVSKFIKAILILVIGKNMLIQLPYLSINRKYFCWILWQKTYMCQMQKVDKRLIWKSN
jgi:hypothetical protein